MLRTILVGASSFTAALIIPAGMAFAADAAYADGAYTGTVVQGAPSPYTGAIGFTIDNGELSGLRFEVTMKCADLYWAQVKSPSSASALRVAVDQSGKFAYSGTVSGTDVQLSGQVRGSEAIGTFFESFHTSRSSTCAMAAPAPFSASLQGASGAKSKAAKHATRGRTARSRRGTHAAMHAAHLRARRRGHARRRRDERRITLVNPSL